MACKHLLKFIVRGSLLFGPLARIFISLEFSTDPKSPVRIILLMSTALVTFTSSRK